MEPSPGIAVSSAPTTLRIDGTVVSSRSTRKAHNTAKGPTAGTRAMATTVKSNTLYGSRQKASR